MQIVVARRPSAKGATLSTWLVNGVVECFGCEDVVRPAGQPFVRGETAISPGTYKVIVNRSERFSAIAKKDVLLPLLLNLPGSNILFGGRRIDECGIRIHSGNTQADTDGCLLPGQKLGADGASVAGGTSRPAFEALFAKIQAALAAKEAVTLTIV